MNNFRGNARSGGGSKFGNNKPRGGFGGRGGSFGGRNARPEMHRAVCDECGKNCEVPFRPTGDRPVLCSNCFEYAQGGRESRGNDRPSRRSDSREKEMFSAVCDNCSRNCEVPFRPSSNKPVYCSDCYEELENGAEFTPKAKSTSSSNSGSYDQILAEIKKLNEKIDRFFNEMEPKVIRQVKVMKSQEKVETPETEIKAKVTAKSKKSSTKKVAKKK